MDRTAGAINSRVLAAALVAASLATVETGSTAAGTDSAHPSHFTRASDINPDVCTLVAEPGNKFTFVRPRRRSNEGDAPVSSTFQVTYVGFEGYPQAQVAFQAAVDIWSRQIASPIPIKVRAEFRALGTNVLGSAGALSVWKDFPGAPAANTYYGDALADRLRGADNSPNLEDITAVFNSAFTNWYFGTDGATPAGQYDFVSVVLHELGHGLGFFGSAAVAGANGSIGISGVPTIYDRFTAAETGAQLTTFSNPSSSLGVQLTSNYDPSNPQGRGVYWGGTRGKAGNGGVAPRHFTPGAWTSGSSYSHFDDAVYPAGDPNSLMTHALAAAEAIHDPGPVVLGLFADMGWTLTRQAINIAGRDFDGDGQQDLIFENSSGHRYAWFMNGTSVKGDTFLTPVPMDPTLTIAGVNDFTGDGKPDLIMENPTDTRIWLYQMNGVNKVGEQVIREVKNKPWHVVATGDINGDNKPDLIWQNYEAGQFYVWFMSSQNNQAIYAGPGGSFLGDNIRTGPNDIVTLGNTTERVVGAADFNSDGRTDLLLRNDSTGATRVWYLNGTTRIGEAAIAPAQPAPWRVASVGDYNSDGRPDIVWQNSTSGQIRIWLMAGVTQAYDVPTTPGAVNPAWKLIGPR